MLLVYIYYCDLRLLVNWYSSSCKHSNRKLLVVSQINKYFTEFYT